VSPSTRTELRRQLGFSGPVFIVPNGTRAVPETSGERADRPTIVVVSRLVPHKRMDVLLGQLPAVVAQVPGLRVEIVGDGPERSRLQGLVADLGLQGAVRLHGRVPADRRDALLSRAWLTTSTSAAEGWGCTIVEAAAWGVPCVALRVPGVRDSVLDGETGWLVDRPPDLGAAILAAIDHLRHPARASATGRACRAWASCLSWDRSADLLAGVVLAEIHACAASGAGGIWNRRTDRSDMAVLVSFPGRDGAALRGSLRATDEVVSDGEGATVLLSGCDEFDAASVLDRLGADHAAVRTVDRRMILAGPASPPTVEQYGTGDRALGWSS